MTKYTWDIAGDCLSDIDVGDIITGTTEFNNCNQGLLECEVVEIDNEGDWGDVKLKVIRSEHTFRSGEILIWDNSNNIKVEPVCKHSYYKWDTTENPIIEDDYIEMCIDCLHLKGTDKYLRDIGVAQFQKIRELYKEQENKKCLENEKM